MDQTEKQLLCLGFFQRVRGFGHDNLTMSAAQILWADMERYGNTMSEAHRTALLEVLAAYTTVAQGYRPGRYAFPLDTGLGKTQSVVAWIVAAFRLGIRDVSVAVSASKVEALCDLKRKLMEHGVPDSAVGLIHSYRHDADLSGPLPEGFASLPSTDNHDSKQFLLITHTRVRGERGLEQFNSYHGKPRDLLIYDESLLVSDSRAVSDRAVRQELAWLLVNKEHDSRYGALLSFLRKAVACIASELEAQHEGRAPELVKLPALTEEEANTFRALLQHEAHLGPLRDLVSLASVPLRVVRTREGEGVITYDVSVPPELRNIVVLDASYPIRLLERKDKSICDGSRNWADGKQAKGIKRYSRVHVRQIMKAGGRDSVTRDFRAKRREDRSISRAVCDIVRDIPKDEAVIIFTFKYRDSSRVDFQDIQKRDLKAAGVDLDATVNVGGKERPRFVWLTWGQETSLSEYSYADNVVLAGVLHRSRIELASAIAGQQQDLLTDLDNETVSEVVSSEIAHSVYQALSRGSCRIVENGEARPMRAWLFHKDRGDLQVWLREAMPGVEWETTQEIGKHSGKADEAAARILAHLAGLPSTVAKLATRKLKEAAGLAQVASRTFTRALDIVEARSLWQIEGRSLIRRTN